MVNTKDINWETKGKVRIKTLAEDKERGLKFSMMSLDQNVRRPHMHPDIEWVYVLKGSFSDENGVYHQGHFLENKKGSQHTLVVGSEGCELVLVWSGSVTMIHE
tara:strand:- start:1779 stop:2090 length:312 start_codon:yes stop_codon:yes gene_type:complete